MLFVHSAKDVLNLLEFLYTGKILFCNKTDFEIFRQLVFEFQIGSDNKYTISIDEVNDNKKNVPTEVYKDTFNRNLQIRMPVFI